VSDVYQDAFGEGSFIGKGIYDVDAFERSCEGRFPDNRILSHDLLEGCYARSGLLSDVELVEDYPSTYRADMDRRHRWIRGDWQLAGWLLPLVPGPDGRRLRNPLSALSLWKLADNLRRSLVPAALVLILGLGWTVLPRAWLWTLAVIAILVMPSASALVADLLRKPEDVPFAQHLAAIAQAARRHAAQALMTLALLPDEATANLDAIVRTGWRMLVSHRRLLEWNPSTPDGPDSIALARRSRSAFATAVGRTGIGPYVAVAIAASMALTASSAWIVAAPILVLWLASPVLAWWVSRPIAPREARLTPDQVRFLRTLARRTWAFFESFVGPPDHFLPPDNWQEHPIATVAHRTSPTNMGLALLANLTAYDFGYLPCGGLVERTGDTLRTMAAMERHDGHFYNWYDTQTLKPLTPLYVSAVDSGNLAGHLMTLRPGLVALADDPIVTARVFEGLADTLRCVTDALRGASPPAVVRLQALLGTAHASPPATIPAAREALEHLGAAIAEVGIHVAGLPDAEPRARRGAPATRRSGAKRWSANVARSSRSSRSSRRGRRSRPPPRRWACRRCASSPPFPWTASTKGTASRRSRARAPRNAWSRSSGWRSNAKRSPTWITASSTTPRVTCSRSATTSPSGGAIRAATTCSRRKRGSRASSPSRRDACPRRTGSRSGACSRPRAANPSCFRGAGRCSRS
jgi:hypothetical protein